MLEISDDQRQNTADLTNVVLICERFQISDRAGAAIGNAALKGYAGFLDQREMAFVNDRNKLKHERSKYREKI